jgi:hypothetical protein
MTPDTHASNSAAGGCIAVVLVLVLAGVVVGLAIALLYVYWRGCGLI